MKCNRCGAELRDGSNFCNFCGNVIEQNNTHTSSGGFTDVFTPINNVNNNINSNNNNICSIICYKYTKRYKITKKG